MDMTDKDNIMIEDFFKQAAQQQIEDNGFTEKVMARIVEREQQPSAVNRRLSLLWTLFCVAVALGLFFVLGGWESLKASIMVLVTSALTSLEVLITTAPTADLNLNPVVALLAVAFVLVYLPYRTAHKLSSIL